MPLNRHNTGMLWNEVRHYDNGIVPRLGELCAINLHDELIVGMPILINLDGNLCMASEEKIKISRAVARLKKR